MENLKKKKKKIWASFNFQKKIWDWEDVKDKKLKSMFITAIREIVNYRCIEHAVLDHISLAVSTACSLSLVRSLGTDKINSQT